MNHILRTIVLLTVLALTSPAVHAEPPVSAAIRAVWADLDAAWNARDPARFSELYTNDSSFEFVDRRHTIDGKPGIRQHFEQQFPRTPATFSHHSSLTTIRPIADGVATADGIVEVRRADDDADTSPSLFRMFAIFAVMTRVGDAWKIDALRIYQLPEPA